MYKNGDVGDLYNNVDLLLNNSEKCKKMANNAYKTLTDTWNAKVAAQRFMNLSAYVLSGKYVDDLYCDGPCSRVKRLKNKWYKK